MPSRAGTYFRLVYPVVLVVVAIGLYVPSFAFEFTIDDVFVTEENREVREFRGYGLHFLATNLYAGSAAAELSPNLYRPLLKVSTALNHRLAGHSFDPRGFHVANALLYALCALVIYGLIGVLFAPDSEEGDAIAGLHLPFFVTLLFVTLPSHLEVVCNIKNREEILACLFGLSAWAVMVREENAARRRRVAAGILAGLLFLLALLSKENAVLVFPCMLLWDGLRGRVRLREPRSLPLCLCAMPAAIGVYTVLRYQALGAILNPAGTETFFDANVGVVTRVLVSAKLLVKYYLWDQLVALKLNPAFSSRFLIYDDIPPGADAVAAAVAHVGVILLSAWGVWRKRSVLAYWVLFFFVTSFFLLNIIPIGTVGAFRLAFTPSLALCVIIALAARRIATAVARRLEWHRRGVEVVFAAIMAALALFYGSVTWGRIHIWATDGTVYEYSAMVAPENPLSHCALGAYWSREGVMGKKREAYRKSLAAFRAKRDRVDMFDIRAAEAFAVVATEIALADLPTGPAESVALADLAIEQYGLLQRLRGGRVRADAGVAYHVKAVALRRLGRLQDAIDACRAGLAISYRQDTLQLLRSLEAELRYQGQPGTGGTSGRPHVR